MTSRAEPSFWRALEDIPGCQAVAAEWRARMGDDYGAARTFLRPTQELAASHPCTAEPSCGCYHDVVRHGPDDIVAVCHCGRECETFPLKKSDIAVYVLDRAALDRAVRESFGFLEEFDASTALPGTTVIGSYSPYSGVRHPVYFTIRQERDGFDAVAHAVLVRENRPLILVSATRELCGAETERSLADHRALFVSLSESLVIDAARRFRPLRSVESILTPFREALYPPEPPVVPGAFFPTPPGIGWAEVTLRFFDGHTLTVRAGEVIRRVTFSDMGMENSKNRLPTKQWSLLHALAEKHGVLGWSSRSAKWGNKKQKQHLSARLREFFRIKDDPIVWDKEAKVYRCRFTLIPEGGDND